MVRSFFSFEFIRNRDIIPVSLLDIMDGVKRFLGKWIGANPTYTRIIGEVRITHELDGTKKVYKSEGLWEQIFFDSNKQAGRITSETSYG
jgi:hypothetical protein